ncbi:LysM peptidoglycan-binding domain-containing protein [bacterium]|nr:LysM peptidoglycan-binding domain-containing protein [bacterium]MBU1599383.1 LysM peptidoglycan-binding domain-containing protein [bacterium]
MKFATRSMGLLVALLLGFVSTNEAGEVAAFNRTTGLINIPVAGVLGHGMFEAGALSALKKGKDKDFELGSRDEDGKLNLGLFDRAELGLTIFSFGNEKDVAGNIQVKVCEEENNWPAIALGLQNIGEKIYSSYGKHKDDYSLYGVASKDFNYLGGIRGHLGIGNRRFVGYGDKSNYLHGLFFGVQKSAAINLLGQKNISLNLMAEVDGRNINMGVSHVLPSGLRIEVAILELDDLFHDDALPKPALGITFGSEALFDRLVEGVKTKKEEEREGAMSLAEKAEKAEKTAANASAKTKEIEEKVNALEKKISQQKTVISERPEKPQQIVGIEEGEEAQVKMALLEEKMKAIEESIQKKLSEMDGGVKEALSEAKVTREIILDVGEKDQEKIAFKIVKKTSEDALTRAKKAEKEAKEVGLVAKTLESDLKILKAKIKNIEAGEGVRKAVIAEEGVRKAVIEKYTVRKRDTLSGIAKKHYHDSTRWPVIYKANRSTITDPGRIYPGQILIIP